MENIQNRNESNPEQESALLNSINRNNVFQTPEHYFEKLPVAIVDTIHNGNSVIPGRKWAPAGLLTLTGFAVVAVVAGIFYFSNLKTEKTISPVLSYEQIVSSGVVADLDETMLFEELDSRIPTEKEAAQIQNTEENEHLKEYLIENNTDITLIINEL